jgi:adenylate cyclase
MSLLSKAIITGCFTGIVGLIVSIAPFGSDIEKNVGLGLLFKIRGEKQAPSDAVIISIDKESSEYLNVSDNPDKWPRSLHARLIDNLTREGAKVIAFDVHFVEPRSSKDDHLFAKAIGGAGNIILCEPMKAKEIQFSDNGSSYAEDHSIVKVVQPIASFARAAASTAPFILPRIPFKVNHYWTFQPSAGDSPTIPVVALQFYTAEIYEKFINLLEKTSPDLAGNFPHDSDTALRNGDVKGLIRDIREIFIRDPSVAERMLAALGSLETSSGNEKEHAMIGSLIKAYQDSGSRYLNYYGPPRTITTIPYYQALELRNGVVGDKRVDLKGKAVFVGLSEILLAERKDSFYTVFSQANGIFISGVEIAATAFLNLLHDTPVKQLGAVYFILVILIWGLLVGVICRMFPIGLASLCVIGLSILYLFFAEYQFETRSNWYPLVVPLFFQTPFAFFGALIWNYIDTNKERKNIRNAFEHYLPKDVVDELAKDIAYIKTGGRVVYGICLYTDAVHYTSLSEDMDPHELGRFMNKYYEMMFKPVKQNDGFVSGVIGDSMLALWISARSETTLKNKACLAAIAITKELQRFYELSSDNLQLKTRIGVHCGQILLGHIGAMDHYEYTPMGDIVNTASRIEGLNKQLGTTVMASEDIVHELSGFLTRELGRFKLVGKANPIAVYELLDRMENADEKLKNACAIFADALTAFRKRAWDEAIETFNRSRERFGGEDGPSSYYIEICEQCRQNPPGETWNDVVCIAKK